MSLWRPDEPEQHLVLAVVAQLVDDFGEVAVTGMKASTAREWRAGEDQRTSRDRPFAEEDRGETIIDKWRRGDPEARRTIEEEIDRLPRESEAP